MVVKKVFSVLFSFLLISAAILSGCTRGSAGSSQEAGQSPQGKKKIKIGITQIVEHPALDAARTGFIDALASKGFKDGDNLEIDYQNAQGDIPTAQTIAQSFASDKKDLILAVATQSAQAAFNATADIPILITAVTDPVQSGLAKSMEKSGTNVTGTSDAAPIEKQFDLLKKLVPDSKTVGVLYNTSESNSEIQVAAAKKIAPGYNVNIVVSGVTSTNDIIPALDALLKKADVLYLPTDNLIASSMPIISEKCIAQKVPVIGAEKGMVEGGALATEGIDYYKLGFQTGLAAVEVLNGKKPEDIPITTLQDTELVVNKTTLSKLGISLPSDLAGRAVMVEGGGKK